MDMQTRIIIGAMIIFFIIMGIAAGPVAAILFAILFAALIASGVGFMFMLAKSQEYDEEVARYSAEIEEAKAVARMGEGYPDILLPGFEYCKIATWKHEQTHEKHYFSVDHQHVVSDTGTSPDGDGWTQISYWNDFESACFLYYRRTTAPHAKQKK